MSGAASSSFGGLLFPGLTGLTLAASSSSGFSSALSTAERLYLVGGLHQSKGNATHKHIGKNAHFASPPPATQTTTTTATRLDGRSLLDIRPFFLETEILPHCSGSARFKQDGTHIVVAVNMEVKKKQKEKEKEKKLDSKQLEHFQGDLLCTVECASSAFPDLDSSALQLVNSTLTSALTSLLSAPSTLPWNDLVIIPGKQAWNVAIDVLVLSASGNLLDAVSIATKAALQTTNVPSLDIVISDTGDADEVILSDDIGLYKPFDASNVPIIVSLTKVGQEWLLDSNSEEECCLSCRLSFSVSPKSSRIVSMSKQGVGAISSFSLLQLSESAIKIGASIQDKIDTILSKSQLEEDEEEEQ